jgi:hypothetical protein
MSSKRKQKTDKKRQENNHSVTKTLQKSENRQLGKAGKILTVDFTGRPCFGRIEKLEGWFKTTEPVIEIVPEYKPCKTCELFLGYEEVINTDILDSMCIDCFSLEIDQDMVFSTKYLNQESCSKCGLYVETKKELYSKLSGICNHCYLRITKSDENHSCIHCDPNFPAGK